MPIRDPDIAIRSDQNISGSIEVVLIVPVDSGLAQGHHHLSLLVQFEDLMPQPSAVPRFCSIVSVRRTLGHPQKTVVVQKETVREPEEACAEAVHHIPVHVKLDDRVQVAIRAYVCATPVQHPEVPAIGIREAPSERSEDRPLREVLPAINRVIRIVGSLGV